MHQHRLYSVGGHWLSTCETVISDILGVVGEKACLKKELENLKHAQLLSHGHNYIIMCFFLIKSVRSKHLTK